jgi:hypothetical protein
MTVGNLAEEILICKFNFVARGKPTPGRQYSGLDR